MRFRRFLVQNGDGFSGKPVRSIDAGEYLDFFVELVDDNCLMLTERDHQLDVMTCISINDDILSVTSSVCVHNLFGRADVLPAHRWIVRSMFKRPRRNELWQT